MVDLGQGTRQTRRFRSPTPISLPMKRGEGGAEGPPSKKFIGCRPSGPIGFGSRRRVRVASTKIEGNPIFLDICPWNPSTLSGFLDPKWSRSRLDQFPRGRSPIAGGEPRRTKIDRESRTARIDASSTAALGRLADTISSEPRGKFSRSGTGPRHRLCGSPLLLPGLGRGGVVRYRKNSSALLDPDPVRIETEKNDRGPAR